LRDLAPTAIYSSTLPRALKTARIIADELGLEIEEVDDLKEISCGEWEGVSFDDVRRTEPELFRAWIQDPTVRCPGGESFADVLVRVERAMETIVERELATARKQSLPLIVAHGLAIRILATGLLRIPLASARNFLQDNAALNVFEWRLDRFVLRCWNDIGHHTTAGSQ
jgi:broad specificity phosphatase PhoE